MSDGAALSFLEQMEAAPLFVPGIWNQLGIAHTSTDELLGDIGICLSDDECQPEIGISLDRHHQGLGIASRAFVGAIGFIFECTGAQRVVGITDTRNTASVRLLTRIGMRKVREYTTTFRGEACSEYEFEISRD